MKRMKFVTAVVMLTFTIGAHAHTHLKMSMPEENAVLKASPAEIMLHFSEPTRLTALSIQKEGEKAQQTVAAIPKEASAALTVLLPALAPGRYAVNWRAVGGDNHVIPARCISPSTRSSGISQSLGGGAEADGRQLQGTTNLPALQANPRRRSCAAFESGWLTYDASLRVESAASRNGARCKWDAGRTHETEQRRQA